MIRTDLIDTKYLHNAIQEMINNDYSTSSQLATPQQQTAQVQETYTHNTGSKKKNKTIN